MNEMKSLNNKKKKISLQTILLLVNLIILFFPIISIHFLKLYENELIRQTESELISQAAFLAAIYKRQILEHMDKQMALQYYGIEIDSPIPEEEYYKPIPATLDLAKAPIYDPVELSSGITIEPDGTALLAGEQIYPILKEAQRTTLADIKILDPNGVAVVSQEQNHLSYALVPEVQSAINGYPMSVLRKKSKLDKPAVDAIGSGSRLNVCVALPVMEGNKLLGVVWVEKSAKNILAALYSKREDLLIAGLIALFLILFSATLASLAITKPVKRLIEQIDMFMQGDKNTDFAIKEPFTDEIAKLANRFQLMAQTVRHRSEYIRDFAMHVSHEFKTPITSINGTIELLQDHAEEMDEEQKKRFLEIIEKDTDRLKRLVERLLELARADVIDPSSDTVDLNSLLSELKEKYKEHNLQLEINGSSRAFRVSMSKEILETVLTNLFNNSLQHGAKMVKMQFIQEDKVLRMIFLDDGEGISEANADKIFIPFFTTNREKGGTGLGMVITRSLLKAHYGDIKILPSDSGAKFEIQVNVSSDG